MLKQDIFGGLDLPLVTDQKNTQNPPRRNKSKINPFHVEFPQTDAIKYHHM